MTAAIIGHILVQISYNHDIADHMNHLWADLSKSVEFDAQKFSAFLLGESPVSLHRQVFETSIPRLFGVSPNLPYDICPATGEFSIQAIFELWFAGCWNLVAYVSGLVTCGRPPF